MENKVQLFEHEKFGKIRVVILNGKIHFVAADACRALEIQNIRQNLAKLEEDEKGVCDIYTPGGYQKMNVVNEPGFYRLIFSSRKKEAREFQRWVYHEVLPSIRKTGSYSAVEAPPAPLALPEAKDTQRLNTRVYAFLMNDNSVKIGYTDRLCPRISEIKREKNSAVKDIYFSPFMSRENARLVEWACQEKFSSRRVEGEFFSVKFEEVCAAIDSFVKMVAAPAINSDLKRGGKIFKVAKRNIIEHANLLADKNPD